MKEQLCFKAGIHHLAYEFMILTVVSYGSKLLKTGSEAFNNHLDTLGITLSEVVLNHKIVAKFRADVPDFQNGD